LVFLGRLSPEKGIAFLIKAIGKLRAESHRDEKQLQLTIIGDGPQKAELQTLVENEGCASMVSFKGHLNRDELIRQLLVSDVCVLPSLSEGYPKARLDAMLCGVPIITSEAGFGREIIGSDGTRGWVVPCGDISALASTIEYVLNAPIDWSGIRHRCREYVEEHTLEAWAQLIGQICSRQWSVPFKEGKLCPQGR
jgi:glycosyltransferase involved in cell wall biosynthesis